MSARDSRVQQTKRARLQAEIDEMVSAFDEALHKLRSERLTLAVDVKTAEAQLLVMWREYMLLADFSKKDDVLAAKLAEKHREEKVRLFVVLEIERATQRAAERLQKQCAQKASCGLDVFEHVQNAITTPGATIRTPKLQCAIGRQSQQTLCRMSRSAWRRARTPFPISVASCPPSLRARLTWLPNSTLLCPTATRNAKRC